MAREANLFQILRAIPPKWAFGVVFALLVYWLTQPMINQALGTSLPSLRSIVTGEADPAPATDSKVASKSDPKKTSESASIETPTSKGPASKNSPAKGESAKSGSDAKQSDSDKLEEVAKSTKSTKPTTPAKSSSKSESEKEKAATKEKVSTKSSNPSTAKLEDGSKSSPTTKSTPDTRSSNVSKLPSDKSTQPKPVPSKPAPSSLEFNFLEEVGRNRFQSPAGLMYVPGSEEGHRLKHLERHLEDQPNRPGSHGVFQGDMEQVLHWIDEAYTIAKKGGRGTKKYEDEDSTVFEATLDKTVGFIGGSDGRRKGNPPTKRVRIVVRGSNVITAFPF